MATNRPVSLPSVQQDNIYENQRGHGIVRAVSSGAVSVMSSESGTSVDNLEEKFVKQPHPKARGWRAVIPRIFTRSRLSRTSSAFGKWKEKQRPALPKLLLFAITASIGVMLVVSIPGGVSLTFMSSILTSLLIYNIIHLRSLIPPNHIQKKIASWGLSDYPTQFVATLPTDFSRDIAPNPCHSHNDYWRDVPLYDAIAAGCTSVEADVWLSGDDLFVGHTNKSLTKERTLESLYIDPLVSILMNRNSPSQVTTSNSTSSTSTSANANPPQVNGVFETDPSTPLTLLIDLKTDGASTFLAVLSHLEPLRSRGYLTHFNGSAVIPGLIIVVGTGNTPFDLLTANTTYRDIFYDAPLQDFWGDDPRPNQDYERILSSEKYNAENSYYASVSFQVEIGKLWHGMLSPQQVLKIRGQIKGAEERGLKARYWDTPGWPVGQRDHVWDVLTREGVGSLNVDDLEAARNRNWGG